MKFLTGCNYATHAGVFARDIIPQRTCFGPMVGQHCSNVDLSDWPEKDTPQIWKVGKFSLVLLLAVRVRGGKPLHAGGTVSLFQVYHNNVLEFYIVTTDENECNWMMFVRKARCDFCTKGCVLFGSLIRVRFNYLFFNF